MHSCGVDHHSGDYTDQQRADLRVVLAFNARMADAIDRCRDVGAVEALLDPDPLRFMWVDEGAGRIPEFLADVDEALARAPGLPGHRRLGCADVAGGGAATRPSVATHTDGQVVYAWLEWEPGVGDRVRVLRTHTDSNGAGEVETVVDDPADCFRPTAIIDASGRPWVLYGRADGGAVSVWCRHHSGDGWSDEERVSDTAHPSFNQEVVAHDDGTVEVCWQGRVGERFAVYSRRWFGGRVSGSWEDTRQVSPEAGSADGENGPSVATNVWDPAVTALPGGGTAYAWTEYRAGSYQVVVRQRAADGTLDEPRVVTSGSDYALHPSLAVTTDGSLWCAFDVLTVQGHGGSGPTRLRPADSVGADPTQIEGMRLAGEFVPPELRPDISAHLRAVRIDPRGFAEPAGVLAPHLDVVPGGLPRLCADPSGGLTIAYRVHRRLPLMTYYWEVATQALGPAGWEPPVTIHGSDGTLEEPAVAALSDGALVALQSDGRLERGLAWTEGFGGRACPDLLEHHGQVVWHGMQRTGTIRSAAVQSAGPPGSVAVGAAGTALHNDDRLESRAWTSNKGQTQRYRTTAQSTEYTVYWGDLHRHSLISRCTAGDEPTLEDFYRYSWDVCEYDFWAVTDHSENSTDYQWWSIQKIADLFRVDGRFVPLYGFEWTGLMGHQNVIYGDVARGAPIFSSYAAGSDTPAGLWEGLAQYPAHPAITIPHHPGSAMVPYDWDYGSEQFLRLAEVFQACRGNYEDDGCFRQYSDGTRPGTFVLDGLRRGQRFGLIASSDHGHGASYVGAYAERLDRASVFEALQARRVFAATTRDVLVDFRVGGAFMGEEVSLSGPRVVEVFARGYCELARVDVLRDGVTVHSAVPDLDLPEGWLALPLRMEWGQSPVQADWSGRLQVDGGDVVATSYWSPEIVAADCNSVRWVAQTKSFGEPYGSQRGGVEVTVAGPADAVVHVVTPQATLRVPLGELPDRVVGTPTYSGQGELRLQPGVGGLVGLGSKEHRLTWTDESTEPAWYYARVIQTDGEMAWSSPVWVDPA
ncbi:MAG: DUF3604 domain-containing protein [Actinomycetota bacterium]|nr:DUF3604 domain-containing protein [Actinomycetota bacterium]